MATRKKVDVQLLESLETEAEAMAEKNRRRKEQTEQEMAAQPQEVAEPVKRGRKKSDFDRKVQRPIQKTVHITPEVNTKMNMVKTMLTSMGEPTSFEDILFDIMTEWLDKNYENIKLRFERS